MVVQQFHLGWLYAWKHGSELKMAVALMPGSVSKLPMIFGKPGKKWLEFVPGVFVCLLLDLNSTSSSAWRPLPVLSSFGRTEL